MKSPISRSQAISTVTISGLSVISALFGLFRVDHYPSELLPGFYIQDVLILLVGVPALLLGLVYARRGSLRGRLLWLGALTYMTYMWASIAVQITFNQFFLGYVLLFGLSVFTLVDGLAGIEADEVQQAVQPRVSERMYGTFLWIIAGGLAFLWLSELVPATVSGTPPLLVEEVGEHGLHSHFIDLSVVVPALAIAGRWLQQQRPWGYVFAGVGLVFGALLAPTLTGMTVAFLLGEGVTVPLVALVFTAVPAFIAAALAIQYLRNLSGEKTSRTTADSQRATT